MEGYFKYHQRQRASISLSKTNYLLVSPILRHTHIRRFPKSWGISKNHPSHQTMISERHGDLGLLGFRSTLHAGACARSQPCAAAAAAEPTTTASAVGSLPSFDGWSAASTQAGWGFDMDSRGCHGILMRFNRDFMGFKGISWDSLDLIGFWWNLSGVHGI